MRYVDKARSILHDGGIKEASVATLNIKNFPDSLHRKLKSRAKRQNRSVAQEVIRILDEAVDPPEKLNIMDLEGLGKEIWQGIDAARYIDEERNSWE